MASSRWFHLRFSFVFHCFEAFSSCWSCNRGCEWVAGEIVCLESCKVEGIWPLFPTSLPIPPISLAGPGAMYNIAAAAPRVWMWLTQRALQDTRIQQWDMQVRAGMIFFFFNHLESQPNVDRLSGKAVKWFLLPAKKTPSCQQWKDENTSK